MHYTNESDSEFYGKFHTYKIGLGDTLQKVSQKLGIDARELRNHHNMHCLLPDLIEKDFKSYSKFLILAPEKSAIAENAELENKPKKVSFGNNFRLPFLPKGINRDYSLEYTFEFENQINTIGMAVRIQWISTDVNKYSLFEIRRSLNLFVDNDAPDKLMYELNAKVVEVLYPLNIVVDEFGKWVYIYNYKEICSRWENKKNEIFEYYKNDALVTKNLIRFADYALKSSDNLHEAFKSDYFLRTFFNGIHTEYKVDYLLEKEISFPLEKGRESIFKIEQKINPYLNDDNLIEVEIKGDYLNSEEEINFTGKLWEGYYSTKYTLQSYSSFIETMALECSIEYDEPIKISLIVEALKKDE